MAYGFIVFPPLGCRFAVATFDIIFVGPLFEKFSIFLLYEKLGWYESLQMYKRLKIY